MSERNLKVKITYKDDSKMYVIRYTNGSLTEFKEQVFRRVPEIANKKIKIYWTGNFFDVNLCICATVLISFHLEIPFFDLDYDNDDIYIVTESDFQFSLENDVKKYFVFVKEGEEDNADSTPPPIALAVPVGPPLCPENISTSNNTTNTQQGRQGFNPRANTSRDNYASADASSFTFNDWNNQRSQYRASTNTNGNRRSTDFCYDIPNPSNPGYTNFNSNQNDPYANYNANRTSNSRRPENARPQFFMGPNGSLFEDINLNGQNFSAAYANQHFARY